MRWFSRLFEFVGLNKGLVSVAGGNIIASITGAIFWLFLASFMPPEEYGQLHYFLSVAFLFSALSLMGLGITVITFLAKGEEEIKFQANLLVIFSNVIIFILLLFFLNELAVVFLLVGFSFFLMSQAEYLGKKQYKKFGYVVISQRILGVGLSLGLYFVMGVEGIIFGYAFSCFLFCYTFFRSFRGFKFQFTKLKEKSSFIIHSYSLGISNNVGNNIDKLLIAPIFGFALLGQYQIGFQFMIFLSIIPLSIFQYLLPQEASSKQQQKSAKKGLIIAAIFTVSSFLAIPVILPVAFPNFLESVQAAQIMVIGILPRTASAIIQSRLFGKENSKIIFISAGIRISSILILIIILGDLFDLIGLAFAILISLILEFLSLYGISKFLIQTKK